MAKYKKKPVVIDAIVWNGLNVEEVKNFTEGRCKIEVVRESDCEAGIPAWVECTIETLEGNMLANVGDYIIRGVKGEYYPCRADIFKQTYEELVKEQ